MTSIILDTIFNETHPELNDLQELFSELERSYQSNSNIDDNAENTQYLMPSNNEEMMEGIKEVEEMEEIIHVIEILSKEQIENFEKIYKKINIDDDENIVSEEQQMNIDINNYVTNLQQKNCCLNNCLKEKLGYDRALIRYKYFIELTKIQQDIFLMGFLSSSLRCNTTTTGTDRKNLACEYSFDGVKICEKSFRQIYGLGNTRWRNLRQHYIEQDIKVRKSALMGRTSNRTTPFPVILKILSFIINFSNVNGFPSPGKYAFIFKF